MSKNTPDPARSLHVNRHDGFWFARLDRPDKRNALSEEMIRSLAALCAQVAGDPEARALVLYGAGGNFCAGADLSGFVELMRSTPDHGGDPIARHNRGFGALLESLAALSLPTLAVVTGHALGGGCGLAACCDRVIAADDAGFAMPEVTLGVLPAQIAPFVIRRAGLARGRWLMLTAERLSAQRAREAGLVDVVAAPGDLRRAVEVELRLLAAAEPSAVRATKRVAGLALGLPLSATLDAASSEFASLLRQGAASEGILALRQKRAPVWHVVVPELPDFL